MSRSFAVGTSFIDSKIKSLKEGGKSDVSKIHRSIFMTQRIGSKNDVS